MKYKKHAKPGGAIERFLPFFPGRGIFSDISLSCFVMPQILQQPKLCKIIIHLLTFVIIFNHFITIRLNIKDFSEIFCRKIRSINGNWEARTTN